MWFTKLLLLSCLRVIVVDCRPVDSAFWCVSLFLEMMRSIRSSPWASKVEPLCLSVWVWMCCPWPKIFQKKPQKTLCSLLNDWFRCAAWIAFAFAPLALLSLQTPLCLLLRIPRPHGVLRVPPPLWCPDAAPDQEARPPLHRHGREKGECLGR